MIQRQMKMATPSTLTPKESWAVIGEGSSSAVGGRVSACVAPYWFTTLCKERYPIRGASRRDLPVVSHFFLCTGHQRCFPLILQGVQSEYAGRGIGHAKTKGVRSNGRLSTYCPVGDQRSGPAWRLLDNIVHLPKVGCNERLDHFSSAASRR